MIDSWNSCFLFSGVLNAYLDGMHPKPWAGFQDLSETSLEEST